MTTLECCFVIFCPSFVSVGNQFALVCSVDKDRTSQHLHSDLGSTVSYSLFFIRSKKG